MSSNITSANATAVMIVNDLFPVGFAVEGFATDQAINQDEETLAVTRMGVDGKLSAGYTPSKKTVHITIEPSSPSLPYFQALIAASENQMTPFEVSLIINIKFMPKTYTYVNGYLTTAKRLPDLKQVLDPVTFAFDFEKCI